MWGRHNDKDFNLQAFPIFMEFVYTKLFTPILNSKMGKFALSPLFVCTKFGVQILSWGSVRGRYGSQLTRFVKKTISPLIEKYDTKGEVHKSDRIFFLDTQIGI